MSLVQSAGRFSVLPSRLLHPSSSSLLVLLFHHLQVLLLLSSSLRSLVLCRPRLCLPFWAVSFSPLAPSFPEEGTRRTRCFFLNFVLTGQILFSSRQSQFDIQSFSETLKPFSFQPDEPKKLLQHQSHSKHIHIN